MTGALRRQTLQTTIGRLILVADDEGLVRILFANQELEDINLGPDVEAGDIAVDPTDQTLSTAAAQLEEYFAGDRTEFDLPLHLIGTDFQRAAWLALADIPYGRTTTYARQAEAIGKPGAFRAVGSANGSNPIPIVLPCHRVVGSDGSLTGFGGGVEIKQQLLDLELGAQQLPF